MTTQIGICFVILANSIGLQFTHKFLWAGSTDYESLWMYRSIWPVHPNDPKIHAIVFNIIYQCSNLVVLYCHNIEPADWRCEEMSHVGSLSNFACTYKVWTIFYLVESQLSSLTIIIHKHEINTLDKFIVFSTKK